MDSQATDIIATGRATNDGRQTNTPTKKRPQTCLTCRARKVRCDGRRQVCSNCERLGIPCSFNGSSGDLDTANISAEGISFADGFSIPRRRARQACQNCHLRKAKCSGDSPRCERCRALRIDCIYRPGKRSRMSPIPGSRAGVNQASDNNSGHRSRSLSSERMDALHGIPTHSIDRDPLVEALNSDSTNIPELLVLKTFDLFFRHLHHIPTFAFLHRASLMQRYRTGLVDRPLLLALVGITTLMTDMRKETRNFADRCIKEAENSVLSELERPTTLSLQTLIFIIQHRILCGQFSLAFMVFGLACRLASALRLNHENEQLCFIARESRRRLMWAVYIIDTSMANGNTDFSLWANRTGDISIQLPCNERNFEFDIPEKSELLLSPARTADGLLPSLPEGIGFLALHVRIRSLRGRILQFIRRVATRSSTIDIGSISAQCAAFSKELDDFAARLPSSFRWSEANVRLRAYSPRLCVFLMTHVWWEQCHCELYSLGLPEALPETCIKQVEMQLPSFLQHCRSLAFEHACTMSDMFRFVLALDIGVPVTDLDLPFCLYQCARTLYGVGKIYGMDSEFPKDKIASMAAVCLQVFEHITPTPATLSTKNNLERLVSCGFKTHSNTAGVRNPQQLATMGVGGMTLNLPQPIVVEEIVLPNATHGREAFLSEEGEVTSLPTTQNLDASKSPTPGLAPILDGFRCHISACPIPIPNTHPDDSAAETTTMIVSGPRLSDDAQTNLGAFALDINTFEEVGLPEWYSGDLLNPDHSRP